MKNFINIYLVLSIIYFSCENNPIANLDCNGIENGLSVEDNCGACDNNPTNDCSYDCSGEECLENDECDECDGNWDGIHCWGGSSEIDECGVCGAKGKLDCINQSECVIPDENGNYNGVGMDCSGICGGDLVVDECGKCDGPGSVYICGCDIIPEDECDCDGTMIDCLDECGGPAVYDGDGNCCTSGQVDECGACDGEGPDENEDCDGNCLATGSNLDENGFDSCGICGGDDTSCDEDFNACTTLPPNHITLIDGNVYYNVNFDIYGWQFNIDGATISGGTGGASAAAGFVVSAGGNIALAFSFTGATIPASCGLLTQFTVTGNPTGLSSIIFDDGNEETPVVDYYQP